MAPSCWRTCVRWKCILKRECEPHEEILIGRGYPLAAPLTYDPDDDNCECVAIIISGETDLPEVPL